MILLNLESLYESLYDALNQVRSSTCGTCLERQLSLNYVCSVIGQIDYCGHGIAPFLLEKSLLEVENV